MKTKNLGILCSLLSSLIFGVSPILVRISYDGGANGITITFLRSALALPVLLLLMGLKKTPLRVPASQLKDVLLVGIFGTGLTAVTLYMSYSYIPVGMATALHFIYPVLVTLAGLLFFKEKINSTKIAALLFATLGILLFFEGGSILNLKGIVLSLISGLAYSWYIICLDHSKLREMHYFKLSFYLSLIMALVSGLLGLYSRELNFNLSSKAWIIAFLIAFFVSVGALSLFQLGIRFSGGSTAAILSTFEPITSIVLGILILKEQFSLAKIWGCIFILGSIVLISFTGWKSSREAGKAD